MQAPPDDRRLCESIEWPTPEQRSRAVREYLAALDAAELVGAPPKHVSMTDPAARWTAAPGCPAYHAYSTNYLVDVESGVIVDVEATSAHRTEETEVTKTMIERVEERPDISRSDSSAIPPMAPVRCSSGSCRTRGSQAPHSHHTSRYDHLSIQSACLREVATVICR